MKILILIPLVLLLAGCETTQTTVRELMVVMPQDAMYKCPSVTNLPKVETLTDVEVGKTLIKYAENNKICQSSMKSLKTFLKKAKARIEKKA